MPEPGGARGWGGLATEWMGRGPGGGEAAKGRVLEPNEAGQHHVGVTNAEGGLPGPGPPGMFGGPAGDLGLSIHADGLWETSGRECVDRTHQPPSSVRCGAQEQRHPVAVSTLGRRSWLLVPFSPGRNQGSLEK